MGNLGIGRESSIVFDRPICGGGPGLSDEAFDGSALGPLDGTLDELAEESAPSPDEPEFVQEGWESNLTEIDAAVAEYSMQVVADEALATRLQVVADEEAADELQRQENVADALSRHQQQQQPIANAFGSALTIDLATFNNERSLSDSTYQNLTRLGDIRFWPLRSAQGGETNNGCAYISVAAAIRWVQSGGFDMSAIDQIIQQQAGPHLRMIRGGADGRFVFMDEVTNYLSGNNHLNDDNFDDTIAGDMADDSFIDQMISSLEVEGEYMSLCKFLLFASIFIT